MASDLGHLSWGHPTRGDVHMCSDPREASLALLPQWVTALLRTHDSYVVPSLPCHVGGWIRQCPKPWVHCTGTEPIPVQAETPSISPPPPALHTAVVAMPQPWSPWKMEPFLSSTGLKMLCKGYHKPHPIETKMEPEENEVTCSSLKSEAAAELGNETSWPTTLGFSFLNKDFLSSLKN